MISFHWKAPMDDLISISTVSYQFKHWFYGIAFGETGIGIIIRTRKPLEKKKPTVIFYD